MALKLECHDNGSEFEADVFEQEENRTLVGIGRARVSNGNMILESIYVTTPRRGIGKMVLENLFDIARRKQVANMTGCLSTFPGEEENSESFYRAMGVQVDRNGRLSKKL